MCTNKRKIFNKYTHKPVYVSCGYCPACQQEKANKRASRIRSNRLPGQMALFVHLTYLNECVPYIKKSELASSPDYLSVYRDYDRVWSRVPGKKRKYLLHYKKLVHPIDTLSMIDDHGVNELDCFDDVLKNIKTLKETYNPRLTTLPMEDKIGICYYRDVQNFIKKLKQNLFRSYGIPGNSFSFYSTAEYGEDGYRPHFHLLIFFDKTFETQFRNSILKSWTYAFRNITSRKLEPAIDAAKYCASYVNKPSDFPPVLSSHSLRAKHSYSKGFGMALSAFQFPVVMEKIRKGDLRYLRTVNINGSPVQCDVPYPSYVIDRYFPKYKGFSRLSDGEICRLGRFSYYSPGKSYLSTYNVLENRRLSHNALFTDLSHLAFVRRQDLNINMDDIDVMVTSIINHAYSLNMSICDYLIAWTQAHRAYKSTLYRYLLESKDIVQQWQCYDNIEDYFSSDCRNDSLDDLMFLMPKDFEYETNLNNFSENVARTELLETQFNKYVKVRRVNSCFDDNNF